MNDCVSWLALFRTLCASSTVQTVIYSQISVLWHKYFCGPLSAKSSIIRIYQSSIWYSTIKNNYVYLIVIF
jgi:hypothetical protein